MIDIDFKGEEGKRMQELFFPETIIPLDVQQKYHQLVGLYIDKFGRHPGIPALSYWPPEKWIEVITYCLDNDVPLDNKNPYWEWRKGKIIPPGATI